MVDAKAGSRKTVARKTTNQRRKPAASEASSNRWSQRVTRKSDALDLKRGVFTLTRLEEDRGFDGRNDANDPTRSFSLGPVCANFCQRECTSSW